MGPNILRNSKKKEKEREEDGIRGRWRERGEERKGKGELYGGKYDRLANHHFALLMWSPCGNRTCFIQRLITFQSRLIFSSRVGE